MSDNSPNGRQDDQESGYGNAYGQSGQSDRRHEYQGGYGTSGGDYASSGQHRGKGPRDYRRSDDRIREDVCDRLTDDSYVDASEIEVKVSGAEVTLTGTVDNDETRRRAEDLVASISGVNNVQNHLRVISSH